MKVAKLVTGILCLVFSIMVLFQSCAAGLSNSLAESGEISGSAGVLVALFMIAGGIVMIVTRKSEKKGGSITGIILFALVRVVIQHFSKKHSNINGFRTPEQRNYLYSALLKPSISAAIARFISR